jgi:hypothetical protein
VKLLLLAVIGGLALVVLPSASAKDFHAGDLRVCNEKRCVPIVSRDVVAKLGPFYYHSGSPPSTTAARLGSPYYELRFRTGYVTGIVATKKLDRFLSYGVDLERFARGHWYAVPPALAHEFQRVTSGMKPLRLTRAALAKSR